MVTIHDAEYANQYFIGPKNTLTMNAVCQMKIKVTLFTQKVQKCFIENFSGETLNLAVLDSGLKNG